ncbi:MAG: molecular chaperone HtpG [Clostridiales Family XIII bacterium]|jgi:molecular chaperone HtpG|nr:molecular chaperone HtpG [Clostridiales Family XIII bacterium]
MAKKQFKAESKRLLDLMINSIYTHKEIFLRELISNASDAIDKLYYKGLTEKISGLSKNDFYIKLTVDKAMRTLTVSDNGMGMTREELEDNLGTIARSGSLSFSENEAGYAAEGEDAKAATKAAAKIDIIGQFGVGFYSAFMVSSEIRVTSRAFGADTAYEWRSEGADGYSVRESARPENGTDITLTIKEDDGENKYGEFLDEYRIRNLIKRYSDYIRYPIKMDMEKTRAIPVSGEAAQGVDAETGPEAGPDANADAAAPKYETYIEEETLNSMVPLWKRAKSKITTEEYADFYKDKFSDFEDPLKVIHTGVEGLVSYDALLFLPARTPFGYYSKDYEKGLQLYSSGVLIMEKCPDLLPDYFGFVKGLVDSQDLSLNISREMLQHDRQLKAIEQRLEKKIRSELEKMLKDDRENYEKFFAAFGATLKYGVYESYGAKKDILKDLLLYYSSSEKKQATLAEYVSRMEEGQKHIYYAAGDDIGRIDRLPQVEALKDKGYEILYGTDPVDEFALKMMNEYDGKEFKNISEDDLDIEESDEDKKKAERREKKYHDLLDAIAGALEGKVSSVRLSKRLKSHPVVLVSRGGISLEMEKVLRQMPEGGDVRAERVLEINAGHKVLKALQKIYENDPKAVKEYAGLLYDQALLIEGLPIEDPVHFADSVCKLIEKTAG